MADPTVIQGLQTTTTGETTIQVRDVAETVLELEPNSAPLVLLVSKLAKKQSTNKKFEEYEAEQIPDVMAIATAVDGASTSITFSHPEYLVVGCIVYIPRTGESIYVTTAPATGASTVVRGSGAVPLLVGDVVYLLGIAREEGNVVGSARAAQEILGYNYCQHFERAINLSNEMAATLIYGRTKREIERARNAIGIAKDIEKTFFLGKRELTTTVMTAGTFNVYKTGGLNEFITTNVLNNSNAALSESVFDTFLIKSFRYGSTEKWFFCSRLIVAQINQWAKNRITHNDQVKGMYGFDCVDYIVPSGGMLHIIGHPLFQGMNLADSTGLGGTGYIVDTMGVRYRYMQQQDANKGGDLKFYQDRQPANANYVLDTWEADIGLERRHERFFGKVFNVAS